MGKKLVIGWFFGGRSVEHEVSVITALQAWENLNPQKYKVIPVYMSKSGELYFDQKFLNLKNYKDLPGLLLSAEQVSIGMKNGQGGLYTHGFLGKFIPLDVVFPLFHGSFGEDGCIQGVLEVNRIPYVGFNVLGSAIGMDKVVSKLFFESQGLPIGKYQVIDRDSWQKDPKLCLSIIRRSLSWPLFVKPSNVGSSIGVNKAVDLDQLSFFIEVAACYAEKILIEESFDNVIEINCSAMGYQDPQASVCEQPVSSSQLLSFEDKYLRSPGQSKRSGGMASATRIIPAPISKKMSQNIQQTTIRLFKALDGCGVARVDYFLNPESGKFWVNEINTIPGSLSFYLWEPLGISYKELLDKLIDSAIKRADFQSKTQYTFESGLLSQMAVGGGIKR